jgi:electron transfer flavoprotein beta subunit
MMLLIRKRGFLDNMNKKGAAMRIAVCIKQIIDPEVPARRFIIDPALKRQKQNGEKLVISSFDENALEIALLLKDKDPATHISVFTVGDANASTVLKTALSMGAHEAVLITDSALEYAPASHIATALACAIKKLPPYDLILTGCVSGDWSEGVIGALIAETLNIPFLAYATAVQTHENGLMRITRSGENGLEIWEETTPLSCSVISSATNKPRYAKLKDIMAAAKKQIPVWSAAEIGFNSATIPSNTEIEELRSAVKETTCEIIAEEEPDAQAKALLAKLRERRAL